MDSNGGSDVNLGEPSSNKVEERFSEDFEHLQRLEEENNRDTKVVEPILTSSLNSKNSSSTGELKTRVQAPNLSSLVSRISQHSALYQRNHLL